MSKLNVREDLTGLVSGRLTAVAFHHKTRCGASVWTCKCSCGNESVVRGYHLKAKKIRSCGCAQRETVNIKWAGHEFVPRWLWNNYRCNAEVRGIDFSVTPKDMWEQAIKQDMKCALTGELLLFVSKQKERKDSNVSLDRIDSDKGYEKGNIQWVLKEVNMAKHCFTQGNFIDMCKKISKRFE